MTRVIPISPKNLEKKIIKLGFRPIRQKGSHIFFKHPDERCTIVPFHKGEDISKGLVKKIL